MKSQDNQDLTNILSEFPFKAPEGHWYEVEEVKRNMADVWLCNKRFWLYKNAAGGRTYHSFDEMKKKRWRAPINSKKPGKPVKVEDMRPWTSMPLNRNPLSALLYD